MSPPGNPTTDGLLAALRHLTNRPAMGWSVPPAPLAGGFWAEMYAVELSDPPPDLEGRLVARIMPDPATAAFETAVQRHLSRHGFPAPSIRCADGPSGDLERAWSVMDFAAGQPLLTGLRASTAIKQAPTLLRRLPDLLADAAATLHYCPLDGLDGQLAGLARQPDIHDRRIRLTSDSRRTQPPASAPNPSRASGLFFAGRAIIEWRRPQFLVLLTGNTILVTGVAALVMALLAAFIPARRLNRLNAATAFRSTT